MIAANPFTCSVPTPPGPHSKRRRRTALLACLAALLGLIVPVRGQPPPPLLSPPASAPKPELVMQTGHAGDVSGISFSPDGKTVATASDDDTLRLWDTATGLLLRTFIGHSSFVKCVCFSPDGRTLASAAWDGTVRLWDVATGQPLAALPSPVPEAWMAAGLGFSPDGRTLAATFNPASGDTKAVITLWDAATHKTSQCLSLKDDDELGGVSFSLDGSALIIASSSGTICLLAVATGKLYRVPDAEASGSAISLSADGRTVAIGGDSSIVLYDLTTGKTVRKLSGHTKTVQSVSFGPGGRTLASASWDGTVRVWDTATGGALAKMAVMADRPGCVSLSPDGRLVAGSSGLEVVLWDAATGRELHRLYGRAAWLDGVAFARDGRTLITGGGDTPVLLWPLASGGQPASLTGQTEGSHCLCVSPDGGTLAYGSIHRSVFLANAATRQPIRILKGHTGWVQSLMFSPDGGTLVSGSQDGTVRLWDAKTGRVRRVLSLPRPPSGRSAESRLSQDQARGVNSVRFSPNGRTLAVETSDQKIRLWDAQTGKVLKTLASDNVAFGAFAFSRDGRTIAGATVERLTVWSVATGQVLRTLPDTPEVSSLDFSPDGKTLAVACEDHSLQLWDYGSARRLRTLPGHTGNVTALAFSPDGRTLASCAWDGSVRLWNAAAGTEICRLYSGGLGWVVVAPDGRFDASELDGAGPLHWVLPDAPFASLPLELFMRQYYEPRLLSRLLTHDPSLRAAVPDIASLNRVQPPVKITQVVPHPGGDPALVDVTVTASRAAGIFRQGGRDVTRITDAYDLHLFRNGQLVGSLPEGDAGNTPVSLTAAAPGGTLTHTFTIRLPRDGAKTAEFTAYAFNVDRVKSLTDSMTYTLPKPLPAVKGRAYIISLGVNDYQDPHWDLRFCANDARRLQDTLAPDLTKTGKFNQVVPIALLSDGQTHTATKATFRGVIDVLTGRNPDPRALAGVPHADRLHKVQPEDLVIVTFSCHGDADSGGGGFYLLPSDIGPDQRDGLTDDLKHHAISSTELSLWLRDVDAGQIALIVDACHSAGAVEAGGFKPGPMGSRGLGQIAYDKGLRILAASQSDNVALESGKIGDGLLTYALVHDGLTARQADASPRDGTITLAKWLRYGVARVPTLSEEVRAGRVQQFRGAPRGTALDNGGPAAGVSPIQQPALFDFNHQAADTLLAVLTPAVPRQQAPGGHTPPRK